MTMAEIEFQDKYCGLPVFKICYILSHLYVQLIFSSNKSPGIDYYLSVILFIFMEMMFPVSW